MNNCRNCRYLSAHYVKSRGGTFDRLTTCGHCISGKMQLRDSDKIVKKCLSNKDCDGCEFWEPIEIAVKEREESILNILSHMQQTLGQMAFTLQDDKDILASKNE